MKIPKESQHNHRKPFCTKKGKKYIVSNGLISGESTDIRELKYSHTDEGFCRVYYKPAGKTKRLYCLQAVDSRGEVFEMLECTPDGEPSHEVNMQYFYVPFSGGGASTDRELNAYLEKRVHALDDLIKAALPDAEISKDEHGTTIINLERTAK